MPTYKDGLNVRRLRRGSWNLLSFIREEGIQGILRAWVLSSCYGKTEARIVTSRRALRSSFLKELRVAAYKGTLEDTVFQLVGGIRSGMGYCSCKTIEDLKENGKFVKITAASLRESHPHDIHITKEAPNYSTDDK